MTRQEFTKGWLILTTQPWGKAYRSAPQRDGEPSPADIQAELYYHAFHLTHAEVWLKVCMLHATGDHWPSIDSMKPSLRDLESKVTTARQIPHTPRYITKEEFGVNLFETIKTISGLQTMQRQITHAIKNQRPRAQAELQARYDEARMFLANLLPTLTPHELEQIMDRYPTVAQL